MSPLRVLSSTKIANCMSIRQQLIHHSLYRASFVCLGTNLGERSAKKRDREWSWRVVMDNGYVNQSQINVTTFRIQLREWNGKTNKNKRNKENEKKKKRVDVVMVSQSELYVTVCPCMCVCEFTARVKVKRERGRPIFVSQIRGLGRGLLSLCHVPRPLLVGISPRPIPPGETPDKHWTHARASSSCLPQLPH